MHPATARETPTKKSIEPVTDLQDIGTILRVVVELPGLPEEKIKIDLEKTILAIHASDGAIRYKKVIRLPCEVRLSRKRFFNGTLELVLEKTIPGTI